MKIDITEVKINQDYAETTMDKGIKNIFLKHDIPKEAKLKFKFQM